MTKDDIIKLSEEVSQLSFDLLTELNTHHIKPTMVDEFYLGILIRIRILTRDVALILKNNNEQQIASAFILLRVVLDDFIRLFSVFARPNKMEEEVIKIKADAYFHRFKSIKESVSINDKYYNGTHASLSTQEFYDKEMEKFKNDPENDKYFADKSASKFKKLPPISETFRLMQNDVKVGANVNSIPVYKFLTQYVHYSNYTLDIERRPKVREFEINQIEEILFYSYKSLLMIFGYFSSSYPVKFDYKNLNEHFEKITTKL
jgi:hypothetical protein